jgi:hypothetical protein
VHNELPQELAFLKQSRVERDGLEKAPWLVSSFDADVWECVFEQIRRMTINFRKRLDDGSLLTDPKNGNLLRSTKKFLCLQTHPAYTGKTNYSAKHGFDKISKALQVIDYFLIKSDYIHLSTHGFGLVTKDDLSAFIEKVSASWTIKNNIYSAKEKVINYLSKIKVGAKRISELRKKYPDLFEIDENTSGYIMPTETIIKARAWIKINGLYATSAPSDNYKYRVSRRRLMEVIIGDRTLGNLEFFELELEGLDVIPKEKYQREFPKVPVDDYDDDDRAGDDIVNLYLNALKSMGTLSKFATECIPAHALRAVENREFLKHGRTKLIARYTTLPFAVANKSFSSAIGFYIEYGAAIVDYYLALAKDGEDPRKLSLPPPEKLRTLGVDCWTIDELNKKDFFSKLRSGKSLYNMLEVLFSSIIILVDTVMARRTAELLELLPSSIVLDSGFFYMAIEQRKDNIGERREMILRPMPEIAAEALGLLSKLMRGLAELGYRVHGRLFDFPLRVISPHPPWYGTRRINTAKLNLILDRFCDYFEIETDNLGRRYYIRPHQLRRNFAMIFFWQGSFGGIEVLRYFLGHKQASQTYRYVTEHISGKALRNVKASVAKDLIRAKHSETEALSQLICERYGLSVNDLYILPEADVVAYIEDLLETGDAEIEPEFINDHRGESYRVIYKVVGKV